MKVKKGTTVGLCLAGGRPRQALADDDSDRIEPHYFVQCQKKAVAPPKKARLAIEAAKPSTTSSAAARAVRQQRRSAPITSGEESVVGGLP